MKAADLQKYRDVSKRMRGLGAEMVTLFGSDPPVGLEMFLCRNLSSPLTDMEWATFMMNNKGNLPSEVATWERWDRFPDRTGCFRFYGHGDPSDVDEIVSVLRRGDELLVQYEDIDLDEQLEWDLPNPVRAFYGCILPDYYCLLELICRESGGRGNDEEITVDGLTTYPDPLDGEWGEPSPLESVALEMRVVDSLASATAQAVESWIPPGVDYLDITVEKPKPPMSPLVESVVIKHGEQAFQLKSATGEAVIIPIKQTKVFGGFVQKVAAGVAGETVPWDAFYKWLGTSPALGKKNKIVANDALRKMRYSLNEKLKKWGRPPTGEDWIERSSEGYSLNASCDWQLDPELLGVFTARQSGWDHNWGNMKDIPDNDSKLPAEPRRDKDRREDDDD